MGWELFSQYVRALREAKPKFFVYENNKSMAKAIRASIDEAFGFEAIGINSALVSAQNRQRLYWVGKRNEDGTYSKVDIEQPDDRGILLKDVLESGTAWQDKPFAYTTRCQGATPHDTLGKHRHTMVAEPVNVTADGKARTLIAGYHKQGIENCCVFVGFGSSGVAEPVAMRQVGRRINESGHRDDYNENLNHEQRFEVNDNPKKTNCVSTVAKDNMVAESVPCYATPCEWDDNGKPIKAISAVDGKNYTVYEVKDGQITINGKQHPIKLPDGFYIIRKLTVRECMRLQTVPDWYEFPVSNTQTYKMLGNGWTVEVIKNLIKGCIEEV